MLKLLLIDDATCKKELAIFIKKQKNAVRILANTAELIGKTNELLSSLGNQNGTQRKIVINTTESITMLNVSDIIRCESNRNYTYLYMANKKKIIVSKTLMEFEGLLHKYKFLRIHKSHLINISYIEKYVKSEGGYIVLTDGSKLPVAVRKKEFLFNELERL
ncbi:MAG: response regulator of the LytR/AlgR family [Bacteroidetes bacterium]|nr:response regulator of the LytR/AlgR family [Bacteroidota bacterium]